MITASLRRQQARLLAPEVIRAELFKINQQDLVISMFNLLQQETILKNALQRRGSFTGCEYGLCRWIRFALEKDVTLANWCRLRRAAWRRTRSISTDCPEWAIKSLLKRNGNERITPENPAAPNNVNNEHPNRRLLKRAGPVPAFIPGGLPR